MKKWEEKKRQQVHQKRVQSAKSTLSKNSNQNYQVTNLKSPVYTNKDLSYEEASPHYTNISTRPSSSKLSDYYGFEKDNLTQIPLYRLLKHFSLQQYAKALISRGYGYELVKLGTLKKEEREALMNEIKILPGHKVKFGNMVSQITSIYIEVIEQEGSTPPRANYSDRANSIMKPSTSQTTRNNHRDFDLPKPAYQKPSSANPGMRRLISPKESTRKEERDFDSGNKTSIRKLQSLGLDYFSDSQSSMDDEFAKALNNIISQYEQGMEKPVEAPKQRPKSTIQPQTSQTKPKVAEKNVGGGDLMTQVERLYNKEAKATVPVPVQVTNNTKGTSAVKPVLKATSITTVENKTQEKFRPASSQNSTATKPKQQEKVKFDLENANTKSSAIPTKKAMMAMDDLGIGNKLEGKSRVLDLLEKKLDSNNLNADNLNLEMKKIKDLYSSFDGATMTSTIANIDIEEMCFCFACAIQKHVDYFVTNILPTYSPLELKYKPKKEVKPAPEQQLPSTNSIKDDENPSQYNPLSNFDDGNNYYIYKGQKVVREDPDFEISQSKTEAAFDRYTKEDNDEVMISDSQVPEEQKNEGLASKRNEEEEEEVLYEEEDNVDAGEYNEEGFQDFLRQSLRQSLYVGGKQETEEEALMRKYNIDMGGLQPVSANWNVYSDKKNARDEEEPEEDIQTEEDDEEEEKLSKSYFSFEESQFVDVEMSALELDMAQRTRLIFEKTYNERNLTQEEINKRIGDKVDNAVISNFCKNVMVTTKMEKEVIVVSLVYVERLMIKTNLYLNSLNWKRICFTAFIIASKIWDDESFENQHFAKVFPQYTIKEINELEKIFLEFIEYDLRVSGSEYAKYYFIMRAFAEKNKKSFSLKALNVQTVRLLQNKADTVAKSLKEQYAEALNRTFA